MEPDQQPSEDELVAKTIAPLVTRILVFVGVVVVISTVVPLVITGFVVANAFKGFGPNILTHGLASVFTITREPYYPDVVAQIQRDAKFRAALGTPIVVDDSGVFCPYVHDDAVQHKANCTIPVHGAKATGSVRVQIVAQAGSLDLGAWLTVGDRTIPINS